MKMRPEVGEVSVSIDFITVVFPAPFGPRSPNTSPSFTSKDTESTALRPLG